MIYLNQTTDPQKIYIPRPGILAGAVDTGDYSAGQNINISKSLVISVTGLTEAIQETVTAMTLDYATTAQVETMISSATSDFVTSGDVDSQIDAKTSDFVTSEGLTAAISGKADTSAVTQSISDALTSYTPTSNFATINGSGITNGGDIVIEGGGDSTALEEITELPEEPVDGAVYNYKGTLIKYVAGPGYWGKWFGNANQSSATSRYNGQSYVWDNITLNYAVLPDSVNGELIAEFSYFTSAYLYFYIDTVNKVLKGYPSSDTSVTPTYTIEKDGANVECRVRSGSVYVQWKDNLIRFNTTKQVTNYLFINPLAIETAHYELFGEPVGLTENTRGYNSNNYYYDSNYSDSFFIPAKVSTDYKILEMGARVRKYEPKVNGQYCKGLIITPDDGFRPELPYFWAPTTSGTAGDILVSDGQNGYNATPPVWKTVAQAIGVDFWTGTQDEYDALESHSSTTLYFIKED